MSLAAIKAGQAFVELTIRDKTDQGLRRAMGRLSAFSKGVGLIGTALTALGTTGIGAALVGAVRQFANVGSELHDMSARTGLAADNLSELKYAAEQTGTSLETVEKAIRFMQKQGLDASKFDQILKAVAGIADESERAAAAMKIFGKGGTALLPMAKELAALRSQARTLGVSMSPEQAALADELGDSFGRFKAALMGLTNHVGAALAPVLIGFTNTLTGAVVGLGMMANELGKVVATLEITPDAIASFITGVADGLMMGLIPDNFRDTYATFLAQALREVSKGPKFTMPDFSDADSILDMKAGNTSRGQFGGFRAESLGVGSGGGTVQKLDGIKGVLEKIKDAIDKNVAATKAIDGAVFT